jgi:hypothetical protein
MGYYVNQLIPDMVEEVKTSSNKWIKQNDLSKFKFDWQKGYGAFTYSRSQIDGVVKYVLNQEQHHARRTFKEEYLDLLAKFGIEYKKEYLFEFFDDTEPPE